MLNVKHCYKKLEVIKKKMDKLTTCSSLIRQLDRCQANPSINRDLVLHRVFQLDEDEVKHS